MPVSEDTEDEWNPIDLTTRSGACPLGETTAVSASTSNTPKTKYQRPSVDLNAWDMESALALIATVEKYPLIWDASKAELKSRSRIQALWEEISSQLSLKKPLEWKQIRQKWANFVSAYSKIATQRRVTKSGQAADGKRISWPYWDAMQFYHKSRVVNSVTSESNMSPVSFVILFRNISWRHLFSTL